MRITPRKLKRVCLTTNSEKEEEECVLSSPYKFFYDMFARVKIMLYRERPRKKKEELSFFW